MKRTVALNIVLTIFSLAANAQDTDVEQMLEAKRCGGCHHMTEVLIGPPYVAIASRHADSERWQVEALALKIVVGGAGNWGQVPMVPNEHVTLDEARAMARWILGLAQESE